MRNTWQIKNILLGVILTLIAQIGSAQETVPLIPKPVKAVKQHSVFNLDKHTTINAETGNSAKAVYYLQTELLKHKQLPLSVSSQKTNSVIKFSIVKPAELKNGDYQLLMSANLIEIKAANEENLFLGAVSLMQLIRETPTVSQKIALNCWNITDKAFYNWRGFMLDESRHFFGKQKVKEILDWMAFYKLNKFHWHLTDQPGWRIEIKQYPRLTLVGGIGNNTNPEAPAQYYTQEDIKEIIRYAADRFIEVIPEIDMPGHATAANLAYPEFSGGGSPNYPEFTFNPGKEETYQYLTNILREVDALFPSQMIHLGADEVHFGNQNWNTDPSVQKLMKDKKLTDLKEVENYFIERMADSVALMNNEVLAWDEVVASKLSPKNTTVYWWRHDKPDVLKDALNKGFKVVLCPRLPLYFDFVQDSTHRIGRKWAGAFVPLESVYRFPSSEIINLPKEKDQIRGMQVNLWTETVTSVQQLDYLMFPRIAALAESAWTKPSEKEFTEFQQRLKSHLKLYAAAGLYYFNPFHPKNSAEFLNPAQREKLPNNEDLTKQEQQKK
ncbi:MAG TPA: beta-N-acetylhexosaminidase [Pelobium sp.]|nr:beta-N-acetylhexosaminidase [Pelobium sp.]